MRRLTAFLLAGVIAAVAVLMEPMLKGAAPRTLIPGVLDFSHAFNNGVSFSLLSQSDGHGRYLLVAGLALLIAVVGILTWRAGTRLSGAAFGLILGGAIANLIDRFGSGSVFDYLALHLGNMPLFVCNMADIAISAGVALLAAESLLVRPR